MRFDRVRICHILRELTFGKKGWLMRWIVTSLQVRAPEAALAAAHGGTSSASSIIFIFKGWVVSCFPPSSGSPDLPRWRRQIRAFIVSFSCPAFGSIGLGLHANS
jgi:hypothetical protein